MHGWRLCPAPDPAALATVEKMGSLLPWFTVNCALRSGEYPFIPCLVQRPFFVHSPPLSLGQSTFTIPLPILDCSGGVAGGFQNTLAPGDHGSPISTFSYSPSLATAKQLSQNRLPVASLQSRHANSCLDEQKCWPSHDLLLSSKTLQDSSFTLVKPRQIINKIMTDPCVIYIFISLNISRTCP